MSERTLPRDLEAERSVLGSILLDDEAIDKVAVWLRPDDFYRQNHADVYKAAFDLHIQGEPVDIVTLGAELEARGILERIGGRAGLAGLEAGVPTAINVGHYAEIVKDASTRRAVIRFGARSSEMGYESSDSIEQMVAEVQREALALNDDQIADEAESVSGMLPAFVDQLTNGTAEAPVWSGLSSLDDMLGGFIPGQLITICGRPGMGKTAAALNVALNAAQRKVPVGIFSLEMSNPELVTRFVAQLASVECKVLDRARRGLAELHPPEVERIQKAVSVLKDVPLYIDDQGGITDDVLVSKARRVALQHRVGLVVIDYLGLLRSSEDTRGNRVQEVGQICHKLKALAKDLKVPVILCAQLSRQPEQRTDKRPQLSDLRESGDIEQDSDVVIGMFRPAYYDHNRRPDEAEAIVLKQRGGSTGTCPLHFEERYTRFYSRDRHHLEEVS